MNQRNTVKQRRSINVTLTVVAVPLLVWVILVLVGDIRQMYRKTQPLTANSIHLNRDNDTITLVNQQGIWQMASPYHSKASQVVADALLSRLHYACRQLDAQPVRQPQIYAEVVVDQTTYHIGELNQASDEVYVKRDNQWLLCDKLLASMAMAPALNFIDKQLYEGQLTAIAGDFGRLTDFSGLDLSVLEIAPADKDALPKNAMSTLSFKAQTTRTYTAFLSEDSQHLLLFDDDKSLIYVVPAQAKLNAIMGL